MIRQQEFNLIPDVSARIIFAKKACNAQSRVWDHIRLLAFTVDTLDEDDAFGLGTFTLYFKYRTKVTSGVHYLKMP